MSLTKIIPISTVSEFKTGDIIQTTSIVPFVRHYAIVFHRNGIPYVADNSFTEGCIRVFTLDDYKKEQDIIGIIRTDSTLKITDELVEQKIIEHSPKGYLFFKFNCENFIRDICGCEFGVDQRIVYVGVIPAIIIISGIFGYFIFRKRKIGGVWGALITIAGVILAIIIGEKIVRDRASGTIFVNTKLCSDNSCEIN